MSEQYSFGGISEVNQTEMDIQHLFDLHISTLAKQKWKIADEITEWSKTLIRQIQEHASDQRKILDQEYEKKLLYLNNTRDQFLEQALIYEQKKDAKHIRQLLNQCETLTLEFGALVSVELPIPSIKLLTEEQLTQINREERSANKMEDEQSRNKLIEDHTNDIPNNTDATESSLPNLTSTNANQTNQQSIIQKSTNDDDKLTISNPKLENNISNHDDLVEKCPTCFMIFPLSMIARDRSQHVNEHYTDD